MTTAADFKALHDEQANLDHRQFLGRFCWYTVSDTRINREELCRLMISVGLQAFLPRPPQDSEAFRRVCTATQRKRVVTPDAKVYCNYLVRDVGYDQEAIYKRIVRETVNTSDRKLSHKSDLCAITYHRATGLIEISCDTYDAVANTMIAEIKAEFNAEKGTINGYGIREMIRKILVEKSNAVSLRGSGGGLYFISEVHATHIDGLEKLAALIPDGVVMFNTHGLMDNDKQRAMLRKAYESESAKEIDAAIREITELISETRQKGAKVPATKVAPFIGALKGAKAKDKEYIELLSIGRSTSAGRLKIFQSLLMQLMQLQ